MTSRKHDAAVRCVAALIVTAMGAVSGCSSGSATGPQSYRNRIPGTLFRADTALAVGRGPFALAVADFDADGAPDIAVANMLGSSVTFLYNAPGGTIFHEKTGASSADTTIYFGSRFRPRALASGDVNADGLPDLVIILAEDSLNVGLDRMVVLLNSGTGGGGSEIGGPGYRVAYDELAGHKLYDLYIGALSRSDSSVNIVAASAEEGSRPVVLSRKARRADIRDGTVNLVENFPKAGAVGVGLREPIELVFDATIRDTAALVHPDSNWVTVTGAVNGGETRTIPVFVRPRRLPNGSVADTSYLLVPKQPYRPDEIVTVALTTNLRTVAALPRGPDPREPIRTTELRLPAPQAWSFETEGLRIVATDPEDGATGVPSDAEMTARFNYWLSPESVAGAFHLVGSEGELPFSADYLPDSTFVTIRPEQRFGPYDRIQLIVDESLKDSTGRATFPGDTLSLRTIGPAVLATVPANGTVVAPADVIPNQQLVVRFNTPMSTPAPDGLVVIGDQSGRHAVGAAQVRGDGAELGVPVLGTFIAGEWVTAVATEGFTSVAGNFPLAKPYVWRYMIRPMSGAELTMKDAEAGEDLAGGTIAGGRFTLADTRGVVLTDAAGSVGLLTKHDGRLTRSATVSGVEGRQVVRTGDLNGDGMLDLVIARADSTTITVLLNTSGAGTIVTFAEPVAYDVGEHPVGLFIGDLNGDGAPDIATANVSSDDVSVLLNNGDGTFEHETFFVVGDHPQAVVGADLDGDGDLDLVVTNSSSDTITLLRNLTTFGPPPDEGTASP